MSIKKPTQHTATRCYTLQHAATHNTTHKGSVVEQKYTHIVSEHTLLRVRRSQGGGEIII